MNRDRLRLRGRVEAFNFALALIALSLVFYFSFRHLAYHQQWPDIYRYRALFWHGWLTTVAISVAALVLSALIGLISALARRSRILALRNLARIYVELVRGTPLLVQILIFYYVVFDALGLSNRYVAGVVILSCFSGAYISEIIRAGIESIGKSQFESARAIGLTRGADLSPRHLPAGPAPDAAAAGRPVRLAGQGFVVAVNHIRQRIHAQRRRPSGQLTYALLESYLPLAAGYLILTLPISLWTRQLEKRLQLRNLTE